MPGTIRLSALFAGESKKKKKRAAERWKSSSLAVSIQADWCRQAGPVLLYQCFADFYEGRSREPVGGGVGGDWGGGGEARPHACFKESSFCCGSGE